VRFGPTPLDEAEGAILAHSVRLPKAVFKKGRVLSADDVAALRAANHVSVVAARLDADDVGEDEAAARVAAACVGENTTTSAAFTGRCNLFAEIAGVLVVDRERLDRINLIDESITVATVEPFSPVAPREMLATVKVIPFAAPQAVVAACEHIAAEGGPLLRVAALRPLRAGLILTSTPGMKASILDRTVEVTRDRVQALGGSLPNDCVIRCGHDEAAVRDGIAALLAKGAQIVMISGASAIVDRRDVIPAAIVAAGGAIDHFGMPVDPGNLMLMAHLGEVPVLGLPGCARSPKLNGFDWVLDRLYAGIPVRREDIMRMGAGGLLKEIASRPLPRAEAVQEPANGKTPARAPRIGAIVLAAGQSRRMGPVNKLLADVGGRPMVSHAVDAVLASKAQPVVVVLGHEPERVEAALAGRAVTFVRNPDYAQGLSTSLKRGIAALPADLDGVIVALGDMPNVTAAHIDKLIAAYDPVEGRTICVPTFNGKRGNPVLWDKRFFREMGEIAGDVGARHLIGEHDDLVCEVAMPDSGVLIDLDTPEALAAHTASRSA
jgi:molybdenum cofactor cytidylyltransferase